MSSLGLIYVSNGDERLAHEAGRVSSSSICIYIMHTQDKEIIYILLVVESSYNDSQPDVHIDSFLCLFDSAVILTGVWLICGHFEFGSYNNYVIIYDAVFVYVIKFS